MRSDMMKLICEDARYGTRTKNKTVQKIRKLKIQVDSDSLDDYCDPVPHKLAMRPQNFSVGNKLFRPSRKEMSEHIQPLWRFLNKSKGKRWDQVHSDLRIKIDTRTANGYHVVQHALSEFGGWVHNNGQTQKDYKGNGIPFFSLYDRSRQPWGSDFYVENGILKGKEIECRPGSPSKGWDRRWIAQCHNSRKHRRSMEIRSKKLEAKEKAQLSVSKLINHKKNRNEKKNFCRKWKLTQSQLLREMEMFEAANISELMNALVRRKR